MVAELPSWKVLQGCSFWPITWCFTHQCLSTPRLHTWPSSFLCLHRWLVDTCENQLYLFADDSTLFAPIRSVNERARVFTSLNRGLEKMRVWEAKWKATFEPKKCKALMLSKDASNSWSVLWKHKICSGDGTQYSWRRSWQLASLVQAHLQHLKKCWAETWSTEEDCQQTWYRRKSNCLQSSNP